MMRYVCSAACLYSWLVVHAEHAVSDHLNRQEAAVAVCLVGDAVHAEHAVSEHLNRHEAAMLVFCSVASCMLSTLCLIV